MIANAITHSKDCRTDMRWHAGAQIRILDSDLKFNGEVSGIEMVLRRGLEPPPHVHSREDEAVYVLRGLVEFTVGDSVVTPEAGQWVHLPRGVVHSTRVLSADAHLLIMFTPSGIEQFYDILSEPMEPDEHCDEIPASSLSYDNMFDMEYIMELGRQFGLRFFPAKARVRAAAA